MIHMTTGGKSAIKKSQAAASKKARAKAVRVARRARKELK